MNEVVAERVGGRGGQTSGQVRGRPAGGRHRGGCPARRWGGRLVGGGASRGSGGWSLRPRQSGEERHERLASVHISGTGRITYPHSAVLESTLQTKLMISFRIH